MPPLGCTIPSKDAHHGDHRAWSTGAIMVVHQHDHDGECIFCREDVHALSRASSSACCMFVNVI